MNLLLDTHTFLWFINNDANLSPLAKTLIEDGQNSIALSIASVWEISIKLSLAKLTVPQPPLQFIENELRKNRIAVLAVGFRHLENLIVLPFHHRDPFDRLIIAQAVSESMPIISRDAAFDAYPVQRLW
jgi:PIN domain nuclease of toxin-antitoxin system